MQLRCFPVDQVDCPVSTSTGNGQTNPDQPDKPEASPMFKLNTTIPLRYWQLLIVIGLSGYAVGTIVAKIMNALGA